MVKRAVVLGGGGVTGVAWTMGMVYGLGERGLDLTTADLFVGTSAGSVVAAQLTSGTPVGELYAHELADTTGDRNAVINTRVLAGFVIASLWPGDDAKGRAWLGRAALKKQTVPESERRAAIAMRVKGDAWPETLLKVPAVDAETGAVRVFDRDSGVSLIDAVAASCAVPLVWPPMTVDGRRYVDGGVRSVANVDLADGYERVVVIAPSTAAVKRKDKPGHQAKALHKDSVVISPTDAALTAIGRNPLNPDRRALAAEAGRVQAAAELERVREVW
ncbi:patatin-like phospholipase family protein [Winogradskya humida]|uniref:Patatin n=1 Tax=Winogradskya humida TaxID=113566 RepID=A0ABQ3ZPE3_9ACTN|nr:patatin-like phospholipase family protein [Actinoplanes humidus]GIE20439.1 patatin [Actinoplanes humidus]